jgi:RHS repeat-associated protein
VEFLATGEQKRTNTLPDGTQQETLIGTDGSQATTLPDGMQQDVVQGPDPRFGMQTPLPSALTVATPGGKTGSLTSTRTASLSDPSNPLSLTSQTDTVIFNGRTATRTYNAATRTFTDTSPAGRQRTTTVDGQGRVVQQQQGNLTPTHFTYNSRGRLSARVQGGRSAALSYDAQGRLAALADPAARTVQFQYDAAGRVIRQTLPDGREITYTYDATGNVTSISPPGRPAHVFTYTPVNLEKDYTAPAVSGGGTQQTLYTYNADRQLTGITRPDGQGVQLHYDAGGRLQTQALPTAQVSYTYAPTTGNLQTVTSTGTGANTVTYSYDGALLTSSTWAGIVAGTVSRTYDDNYRITSQSVNGGNTISFTYDKDDLLTGAGAMTLSRDAQTGLLAGTSIGTVSDTLTYNDFGELSMYEATVSGTAALTVQYTRDTLGRITQKTETIGGVTDTYVYSYDQAGRLTEVKQNGVVISTYTYDANSNRLTGPTGTTTYTYDAQDRFLAQHSGLSTQDYGYTANGELQSKTVGSQTTTYTYDVLGNLLSVTLPDDTQIEYIIDGENRRIGKKVNGTLVQEFLYQDQLEPVAELDGSGNIVARFVYGSKAQVPDYLIKNGATYRIISDHLGSPRLVIDTSTNTLTQRMDYDEFGNIILDTNPGFQPFGFAGGLYDQHTKLTRFGVRDYDAEVGRWTAKDPLGFAARDSNLYGYVLNDPVNFVDPDGKFAQLIGGFAGGTAAGALVGATLGVLKITFTGGSLAEIFLGAAKGAVIGGAVGGLGGLVSTLRVLTTYQVSALEAAGIGKLELFKVGYFYGFYGAKLPSALSTFFTTLFGNERKAE